MALSAEEKAARKAAKEAAAREVAASAQVVRVGERRISATWANNLSDVLPGDFTILKQHPKGAQVWLTIGLSDGQRLLIASGDLLDKHMTGTKVFGAQPREGEDCPLREGLKIGVKDGNVQFA